MSTVFPKRRSARTAMPRACFFTGSEIGPSRDSLPLLGLPEIDQYLSWRMPGLRRATRHGVSQCLRSFLRYLHAEKFVAKDLSPAVSGPIMYKFEDIPRAFTEQQVKALLETTRRDKTPTGLRDHAVLMLLSTYGLRAGEVVRLRLDDIDWRAERLRIRQSKSGVESFLPLLPPVGEALLKYLRRGRPQTEVREVFLRVRAPHGAFPWGGSLHTIIQRRLKQAGIQVKGRHGAHAFRFAQGGQPAACRRATEVRSAICWAIARRNRLRFTCASPPRISGPLVSTCPGKENHAELAGPKRNANQPVCKAAQPELLQCALSLTAAKVPAFCDAAIPEAPIFPGGAPCLVER